MELLINNEDRFHIISIIGDLDASSSVIFDSALEEAINSRQKNIFIDCSQLDYISSPGIGAFTSRLEECTQNNIHLVLYGMSEKIQTVFKILGLDLLIVIKESKEEAKNYVDDAQFTNTMH
ncbi:MAG: STAS domain-containing protein [Thermoflexibacter sp.]|jgi:anti-sigma B factor antagonist|nr:STAS domain-containing protein [Thermoflexibacter sp.]